MKAVAVLVTTCAATTLFTGTIVGGLAMQGRLNFEGTQGIPLLHEFFEQTAEGADGGEGGDPHDTAAGDAGADAAFAAPPGGHAPAPRIEGMGREDELGHAVGPSVRGEEPPTDPVVRPVPTAAGDGAHPAGGGVAGEGVDDGWRHQAESLMGQDQYRRGKLFKFARMDAGMSTEELNRILASVNELRESLEGRAAVLDQREAAMNAREADIEERGKEVRDLMRKVIQAREQLKEDIAAFERTYTLVQRGKLAELRDYAKALAGFEPEKATEIVRQMWRSEEGKTRVTRIFKVMADAPRQEILALLTAAEAQEMLDRLAKAVVEKEND